jgi:predicted acetyltransferase
MMREVVRELAGRGVALSALYASTQSLYRQVGYEAAGSRFRGTVPVHRIGVRGAGPGVEELTAADQPAITRCYEAFAREQNGTLDRGAYAWSRMWKFREQPFHAFGVRRGEELDGYVFLAQTRKPESGRHDVTIGDLCFRHEEAGRRLLGLVANFSTIGDEAVFFLPPWHPGLVLMPLQTARIEHQEAWMLRVCDVRAALTARGYAEEVRGRVALEIEDETVEANRGVWTVALEGGRAVVTRGGEGSRAVRCGARGLAAMYTGYLTPREAARAGLAAGCEESLSLLGRALAGPRPWMTDFF